MNGKINHLSQVCSLNRYTLTEGAEKGLDIIDCSNGKIRFLLNVSKALDIPQLWHEGQNVAFVSKNGLTAREIPFLNRFEGGMLYTCGLDSAGGREGYELHGTHHNTPALVTKMERNEKGITVEAEVRETALFGKNLLFKRKVFLGEKSDTVEINDSITNLGYKEEGYCILYHVNLGYPMLDEGATIVADIESVKARTPFAEETKSEMLTMTDSVPNQEETCYFIKMKEGKATLVNDKIKKAFTIKWSKDTLPEFVEWKSMGSGDYALGLEPCSTELDGGFKYKYLKPQESVEFSVTLTVEKF